MSKRMGRGDYNTLLERIRTKLLSWTGRFLSYAGRLQLLKSVISGIIHFWVSAFRLPKKCIKEINGMCSAFLWSGPQLTSKAKISWTEVCKTKQEGGLGIRNLEEVMKVFSLKLIWRLLSSNSLWADWVKCYLIRKGTFWSIGLTSSTGSWIWKKLIKLRSEALHFHRMDIGNGSSTSFWYDAWSTLGRLIDLTGFRGSIDLGIPINAKVSEASISHHQRHLRSDVLRSISQALTSFQANIRPSRNDIHLWRHNIGIFKPTFDSKKTWAQTRESYPATDWNKAIWFPNATPKYSFLVWIAVQDRLSTGDRMKIWNPGNQSTCSFCGCLLETRNHLFFSCRFSAGIWKTIYGDLIPNGFNRAWDSNITLLSRPSTSATTTFLLRYAFQASVYHIWRERNARRHGKAPSPQALLVKLIDKNVRNRISSITNLQNPIRKEGLHRWFSTRAST